MDSGASIGYKCVSRHQCLVNQCPRTYGASIGYKCVSRNQSLVNQYPHTYRALNVYKTRTKDSRRNIELYVSLYQKYIRKSAYMIIMISIHHQTNFIMVFDNQFVSSFNLLVHTNISISYIQAYHTLLPTFRHST